MIDIAARTHRIWTNVERQIISEMHGFDARMLGVATMTASVALLLCRVRDSIVAPGVNQQSFPTDPSGLPELYTMVRLVNTHNKRGSVVTGLGSFWRRRRQGAVWRPRVIHY